MGKTFTKFHPAVNLLYFVLTVGGAMALNHPVCLALSLGWALWLSISLLGKRTFHWGLPLLFLFTALMNPLFSHAGATILCYLPSGNPLTLESIFFGVITGCLLATVLLWFSCFNAIMTTDKLVFLFGRAAPALSLVLAMALRFVPRFVAQAKAIVSAQTCLGRDIAHGKLLKRIQNAAKILSILITWALENTLETADSMKSRGYGLPGRTAFSLYRISGRDKFALGFLALCGGLVIAGAAVGRLEFHCYPTVRAAPFGLWQGGLFSIYFLLCGLPLWVGGKEALQWKRALHSKT
jgi:energy-coupling factor transport system permease protein